MNDTNELQAETVLAECLRDTMRVYLALLEDGNNKAGFKEAGATVRHLATCLQEASFAEFGSDDDPEEESDDMEKFYADSEEAD